MLKTLIKKQFSECFKSYFINPKTGKPRSKGSKTGVALLYGFVIFALFLCFGGLSFSVARLIQNNLTWLYFTIVGIMAVLIGVVASAFNTFSTLYKAKDNDFLLSMPIKPSHILYSRIALVFGLGLVYSGSAWIPGMLVSYIFDGFKVINLIYQLILLLAITLFVTALSCALGFIIAKISTKIKNRGVISALLIGLFIAFYYYASFNLENLINSLIVNSEAVSDKLMIFANLMCQLGKGATGEILGLLIFVLVSIALFALCFFILTKTFIKIATNSNQGGNITKKNVNFTGQKSVKATLLKKEFKRFTSSTIYLLNCGLGALMTFILVVFALIKMKDIGPLLVLFKEDVPEIYSFIPLLILLVVSFVLAIDCISTPSISLEGKNLWILKSLPASPVDVLTAKENLHVLFNGIPATIAIIVLCFLFKLEWYSSLMVIVIGILLIDLNALLGLVFGLLRPNFNWTNEAQPIKQNVNVIFVMLIVWLTIVGIGVGYYFLRNALKIDIYLALVGVVLILILALIKHWLRTKGTRIFELL